MLRELAVRGAIFDLPARKFVTSSPRDLSVLVHGRPAATPLGPAAGPHTQLAQNIVLSWLAGGRVIELKTVQVLDELEIPRPCIDMQTIGFNVEWSQELKLEQSLEEYVKAAMLVTILARSGVLSLSPGFDRTLYEISVGYDLKGIASPRVQAFLRGMQDAGAVVERLRRRIPDEHRALRDLDFPTRIASSVTLSTFHGCPPGEIEQIAELLMRDAGLDCTIKLNPTLLGRDEVRGLLHDALGYRDVQVPDEAFERDARWEQVEEMLDRLASRAASLGRGLGVKCTNTLVVKNDRPMLQGSPEAYLSGPPLYVLAMHLVRKIRRRFGDRLPISFSGGIDASNFPDAVALGLAPVTVCTDWLKAGGYGRAHRYFEELDRRMARAGAATIGEFIVRARGLDPATPVSEAALLNTEAYVGGLARDPRYDRAHHDKPPRKIGHALALFDCVTCDKCIPVCPNDANFSFAAPHLEIPVVKVWREGEGWARRREGVIRVDERHQIGNFADLCNECGNCDVFCPEDGGPWLAKPRFFGSLESFQDRSLEPGFYLERRGGRDLMLARFQPGEELRLEVEGDRAAFSGPGFSVTFDTHDPEGTLEGRAEGEIDLTRYRILEVLRASVLHPSEVNYVSCLQGGEP